MSKSVFCTATVSQTNAIINDLQIAGFSGHDISVLLADKAGTQDFAEEHNTKAPEGCAAVGGTVGGLTGTLIGMGIPESEAEQFVGKVKTGSCLVSVHSEDGVETQRAEDIFERHGGKDITAASEV